MAPPNSYDVCACGHPYPDHDPVSLVCRFSGDPHPDQNCGCVVFTTGASSSGDGGGGDGDIKVPDDL